MAEPAESTDWVAVAARSQAYLALQAAVPEDGSLTARANFLMALGLTRRDAAELLGSSDDSLRTLLRRDRAKKGGGGD